MWLQVQREGEVSRLVSELEGTRVAAESAMREATELRGRADDDMAEMDARLHEALAAEGTVANMGTSARQHWTFEHLLTKISIYLPER